MIKWNKKCPNCGGEMADTNKFCSKHCYEIYQMKQNGGAIAKNMLLMVI